MQLGVHHRLSEVIVDGVTVEIEPVLRFLGVMITSDGRFAPWYDFFNRSLHTVVHRLAQVGLSSMPIALINNIFVLVMPALLFGAELWGIDHIYDVLY